MRHGLRKTVIHFLRSTVLLIAVFVTMVCAQRFAIANDGVKDKSVVNSNTSLSPTPANQQSDIAFDVTPKRCVTLRQGQPCFVRVRFEWQSAEAVQVCVYGVESEKLMCWNGVSTGRITLAQTLPGTTDFVLADKEGNELKRASVDVSWVYRKKRSKRRWRLF